MIRSLTKKDLSIYVKEQDETCCQCVFKYLWFYCCPLYYLQQENPEVR